MGSVASGLLLLLLSCMWEDFLCVPLMAAACGWRQGNVSDGRCVCLCRKKDDETGCAALPRVAVSPLNRVDLCCEQTSHKETALSLGNTTNKPLYHPCRDSV